MADLRISTSLRDQPSRTSPATAQLLPNEAVLDALQMIFRGRPLNEVLTSVTPLIETHNEGMLCSIFLVEDDGLHLRYAAAPNLPEAFRAAADGAHIGPSSGSCGTAVYLRQPIFVSDIVSDPKWVDFRDIALQNGLRAAWSSPIMSHDGKVLGTFGIVFREVRHPGPREIQLIDYASRIAAIAIERTQADEAFKRSEQSLRNVIETIPAMAWTTYADGARDFANQRWLGYTGVAPNEMAGTGWKTGFHPEDIERHMEKCRESLATGKSFENEARVRCAADGRYRWFLHRAVALRDERGDIVKWYGTASDIEDLKQAETKLRRDEEELRHITDAIPMAIIVLNPDGSSIYANQGVLDYTGLTSNDVIKKDFRERVFHPEDIERLRKSRQDSLVSNVPFENEQRALGKDGKYRWFLVRYNPLLDEAGKVVRWYATATDIHDRVKVEERTRNENTALREQIDRDSMFEDIVGSSEPLRKVLRQVAKVAPSDSTVLILGETGTGKELIARAIHKRSKRAQRAFIAVNCAAIPPSLIASELFGYEKGAFTGATQRRLGRFESANGGTIFLDEVGDLPHEIQIALLRVLQEREIERVGSNVQIPVDVRVLAATHRDLDGLVAQGKFREDLLYRLNVVPIAMPSLRERANDLPLLVEYFIACFGKKIGKKFRAIDDKTLKLFHAYGWPGNVRELQNVIERAVILNDGDILSVDETWLKRQPRQQVIAGPATALGGVLHKQEKEMIEAALAESQGQVSGPRGAAAKLGIPTKTLDSKIKRLGINKYHYKSHDADPVI